MSYDPFSRGPYPVGVRTVTPVRGDRPLPVEVWYPATDAVAGRDLAPETRDAYEMLPGFPPGWQAAVRDAEPRAGRRPLIAFSHGLGGHRRQSTFLCTHLASHGYVVAAVDHTGNTVVDIMQAVLGAQMGVEPPSADVIVSTFIPLRPDDVSFMISGVLDGSIGGLADRVDGEHVGMTGHSFGGWTTLAATAKDRRIRAALPLAPAGGTSTPPLRLFDEALDFAWGREVPTLFILADRDTLLPLEGLRTVSQRTQTPKRTIVLGNADHMHFCDQVEQVHEMFRMMPPVGEFAEIVGKIPPISDLCPGEHAHDAIRGLGLAHMDSVLRGDESAAALLAGDVPGLLADRGIRVTVE